MQRTKQDFRQQWFLPDIDRRQATWQAYMNCQNAFMGISMISGNEEGGSLNVSRTPQETFVYCLGVLDAYLDEKDEEFKKDGLLSIADMLDKNPPNELGRFSKFSDYLRYWSKVKSLMERNGFYSVPSDTAHI